jgi:hypothetical protein
MALTTPVEATAAQAKKQPLLSGLVLLFLVAMIFANIGGNMYGPLMSLYIKDWVLRWGRSACSSLFRRSSRWRCRSWAAGFRMRLAVCGRLPSAVLWASLLTLP